MTYTAILFDAGQTLLRVEPSPGVVYARVAARYGISVATRTLEAEFRALWKQLRPTDDSDEALRTSESLEEAWWRRFVAQVFERVGANSRLDSRFGPFFNELYETFARPEVWHVFPDVQPALDKLESLGLRCAVVSNWDARLPGLLERLNLKSHFEFVLTSAEAGFRKPHPRIFAQALERLNLPAQEVVYVGDSLEDDVAGAERIGMMPLLIDRNSRSQNPAQCIRSLVELPEWVELRGS
ncbi:MAG: HAD-IA family hydrolase [Candidatus Hydrogenedentes bacterium]|nr:HAD-IA family hydrolase [Candidatus Hydrogenedentota bacterium]